MGGISCCLASLIYALVCIVPNPCLVPAPNFHFPPREDRSPRRRSTFKRGGSMNTFLGVKTLKCACSHGRFHAVYSRGGSIQWRILLCTRSSRRQQECSIPEDGAIRPAVVMNVANLSFGRRSGSRLLPRLLDHDHLARLVGVSMLGLTISRRAIQVPAKRFATRSISRPTVSFRPNAPLTSDSTTLQFRQSFKTPFTRFFHHDTVSASTQDTAGTSNEQQELSRYVLGNSS